MAGEKTVTFGLNEKAAYILIYLFGWISGLIFYLSEKEDRNIRLHALQVTIFSAGITVIWILLGIITGAIAAASAAAILAGGLGASLIGLSIISIISWIINIAYIVLIIVAIVRACNGSILKLPVAYNIAEKKV